MKNRDKSNFFKKYHHTDEYNTVFNSELDNYKINIYGNILDSLNNNIQPFLDSEGELVVKLRLRLFGGVLDTYKISHLVQHTFKPTKLPVQLYKYMQVLYRDGNLRNLHPENLVWHWTGLEYPLCPGYAIIPGASDYCISIDGDIIRISTDKNIKSSLCEGYYTTHIVPDVGVRFKARIHRLICLAWTDYPANVDALDINHIDGIKTNNDPSNLEWCTSKENNEHACRTGLFINRDKKIIVRFVTINRYTGNYTYEEKQFQTLAECGRYFKVSEVTIGRRIYNYPSLLFADLNQDLTTDSIQYGVQFKLNDGSEWQDIDKSDNPYLNSQLSEPVKYANVITGEIKIAKSTKYLASIIGCNNTSIIRVCNGMTKRPIFIYDVKYITDTSPWLKFTTDQIEVFKLSNEYNKSLFIGCSFKITHSLTNEIKYFINIIDICRYLFVSRHSIDYILSTGKLMKDWKIEKINLEGSLVEEENLEPLLSLN